MSETGTHIFEWPTLHLAARARGVREVKRKVALRADINEQDKDGSTPLHLAIWNNHEAVARVLVETGAELNLQDRHGNTPLHIAAYVGDAQLVELLLVLGADRQVKNNQGQTPIDKENSKCKQLTTRSFYS